MTVQAMSNQQDGTSCEDAQKTRKTCTKLAQVESLRSTRKFSKALRSLSGNGKGMGKGPGR